MHISNEELSKYIITLVNFDFSPAQIKRIIVRSVGIKDKLAEIDNIYPKFCKNMLSRGYTEEQIRQVVCYYPPAMFYKFYHKELSKKFISCINEALSQDITIKATSNNLSYDFDGIYEILTDLGVSEKRIEYIFRTGPEIIFMTKEELKSNIAFYKSCNLTGDDIVAIINNNVYFLDNGEKYYEQIIERLAGYNLTKANFGTMLKNIAKRHRSLTVGELNNFLDWAETKPMNKEKLGRNLLRHPSVCCKTIECLEDGFEKLLHLGFKESEAGEIFSSELSVTTISYSVLKEKFDIPKKYNCQDSDIKEMILGAPVYLTLSAKSLDKKFAVYDYYDLLDFVLENPRKIVQPSDLTEARASYLKTYCVLSDRAYCQMVFTSKQFFAKRFGVESEDILTLTRK